MVEAFDPFAGEQRTITFKGVGLGEYVFSELTKPKMDRMQVLAAKATAAKDALETSRAAATDTGAAPTTTDTDEGILSICEQIELMLSNPDGSAADGLADSLMNKWTNGVASIQYLARAQAKLAEWAGLEEDGDSGND